MLEDFYFHKKSNSTQAEQNRNRRESMDPINKNPSCTPRKLSALDVCEIRIEKYQSGAELLSIYWDVSN